MNTKRGLIFILVFLFSMSFVFATDYYSSPNGTGTNCLATTPCTVNYAVNTKAQPGDIVLLKNGVYMGDNYMLAFPYDDWNVTKQSCRLCVN